MEADIETLRPVDNTAIIYRTRVEQFAFIRLFIQSGLRPKESCISIANDIGIAFFLSKLAKGVVDISKYNKKGSRPSDDMFGDAYQS